jgi:protein-tyrosine phosphatase
MGNVDIHFHLLPGVDDGPSSVDESLALASAAVADGTQTVVATPHVHPQHITEPAQIPELVRELVDRLRRQRIGLDVRPGGELAHQMVQRLTDPELQAIAQGTRGHRWVLLEAPFAGLDDRFTEAADELRHRGFGTVIAHPERTMQTPATDAALARERVAGSVLQLTAGSFTGLYGERTRADALTLLRSAPRAVIASDAHGGARMPALRSAVHELTAVGEGAASRFVADIPYSLLKHGLIADYRACDRGAKITKAVWWRRGVAQSSVRRSPGGVPPRE